MNKTFEQEWNLYKAGGKRPSFEGEAPRGDSEFDSPVKVGEIRIFADMARPFVALVAQDRGNAGFFSGTPAQQRGVLSSAAGSSIRLMAKSWRHW